MGKRGRPPQGVAAKTGAQRAWEYRARIKQRRVDETIETNRTVRKLQVELREATQQQAEALAAKLRDAERLRHAAEAEAARLRRELERLTAGEEVLRLRAQVERLKKELAKAKSDQMERIVAAALGRHGGQLQPVARSRLVKALGMLGSAYDGERASAAETVERLRRATGLQWDDLIP